MEGNQVEARDQDPPQRMAAWMPPPRLPVFTGEAGDEAVDTFVEEAERIVVAYGLRGAPGVEVIIRHLAGQARTEVLCLPAETRQDVAAVLGHLRTQFADQRPLLVLMDEFHARTQKPGESLRAFEHALQGMARKIAVENPAIYPPRVVRDHYCKGLADSGLRQFMRNWVVDHPDSTIAQARERAMTYASEAIEPMETMFQQKQTWSAAPANHSAPPPPPVTNELESLKSQVAVMTESLAAVQSTLTMLVQDRAQSGGPRERREQPEQRREQYDQRRDQRRYPGAGRCFYCGRFGHIAANCRQPPRRRRPAENESPLL